MSRWQELFNRQHAEERAGTADPAAHAQERVDLREELEDEQQQEGSQDAGDDDDDAVAQVRLPKPRGGAVYE